MKRIRVLNTTLFLEKEKRGNINTIYFYNEEKEKIPFYIIDDGDWISLYHKEGYVYKTYSQTNNKWRMIENIVLRI